MSIEKVEAQNEVTKPKAEVTKSTVETQSTSQLPKSPLRNGRSIPLRRSRQLRNSHGGVEPLRRAWLKRTT